MEDRDLRLVESGPLRYLVAEPTNTPSADAAPPVLCFLHGYDEGAPAEIHRALTAHGPLRPGASPRAGEFLVVAPQLPERGDRWRFHADDVLQIVREVRDAHGGDARRTYLTGFSFGGNGVFDLALAQPGTWAALWAVDPTRVPREDVGRPAWLSIGQVARYAEAAFVRAMGLRPAAGAAPEGDRLYLDEGEDHVGSATRAYRDDRIYTWLLSKQFPAS